MAKISEHLKRGLVTENPTFIQVLGMCPTLATTTSALNGLGMGLSVTVVLIGANLVISLLRKAIPDKIRMICSCKRFFMIPSIKVWDCLFH